MKKSKIIMITVFLIFSFIAGWILGTFVIDIDLDFGFRIERVTFQNDKIIEFGIEYCKENRIYKEFLRYELSYSRFFLPDYERIKITCTK